MLSKLHYTLEYSFSKLFLLRFILRSLTCMLLLSLQTEHKKRKPEIIMQEMEKYRNVLLSRLRLGRLFKSSEPSVTFSKLYRLSTRWKAENCCK